MENILRAELLTQVKKKKECSKIPDAFIEEVMMHVMKSYKNLETLKASEKKVLVKEIRAKLRRSTGMFQKGSAEKKRKHLEVTDVQAMLKTHISTAERLADYPFIKEKISTLGVKSILDIGCGLNPLALASKKYHYDAYDIRQDEIDIINDFFSKEKITGSAQIYDVRKFNNNLPQADICLLWKVLEIIGGDTHKLTKHLLKGISCKYFLISFPTQSLSGKRMHHKRRVWLERLLKEEKYSYETFELSNEIFYLVKNSSTRAALAQSS